MSILRSSIAALSFIAAGTFVQAGTLGLNPAPIGAHGNSDVQFALWDLFTQTQVNPPGGTTYTFNGTADGASTLTSLSLSQNNPHALGVQGSGLLSGGDVYYSSTAAQSWTMSATASIDISTISFQIKTANVNTSVESLVFLPTLTGVGPATHFITTVPGDMISGFAAKVVEYRWTGLDIDAGTVLNFTFSMAGGSSGDYTRKPVDFIALDVTTAAVPEPGSLVLCGLGALVWPMMRRRARR